MSEFDFATFRESDWVRRHCRSLNPENPFHSVEYPDGADRVMLVTGTMHRHIDGMDAFAHIPVGDRCMLRKRLNLDTLALEVYEDKKFSLSIPHNEWGEELASIIKYECTHYLNGWNIY